MKLINPPLKSVVACSNRANRKNRALFLRLSLRCGAIIVLAGFLASSFYSSSSASLSTRTNKESSEVALKKMSAPPASLRMAERKLPAPKKSFNPVAWPLPAPLPQVGPETIATYASDCTTPKTDFAVGETVCLQISGITVSPFFPRRLLLGNANSTIIHSTDVTSDPQTSSFTLDATSIIGGNSVDNRGSWHAVVLNPFFFFPEAANTFTVADPANATSDVGIATTSDPGGVQAGTQAIFELQLKSYGPDNSANVQLMNAVPAGTTFVSFQQLSGPIFNCDNPEVGSTGTTTCSIVSLEWPGPAATFLAIYQVNEGTPANTEITNTASISSNTDDQNLLNNSTSVTATVVASPGGESCSFDCPNNITVTATDANGTIVTFASAVNITGSCGAISASPSSGSLFPVGTTVVTVTSETGPSCAFTVTVTDTPAPTISCPPDQTVTADSGGTATVNPGTPTTTPATGVTITSERSDDVLALTDPYQVGTTGITWTVTDSIGRTASCTQRIIVHAACADDTAPPTITAPADISVGTGPGSTTCGVVLDDELGLPEAQDDCSVTISTTGIPSGNLFPIGTTTITYTATDGAGHTATAAQTVTVTDNTPPSIAAPPDANYVCLSEVPAASPSQATRGEVLDEDGNPLPPGPPFDNCGSPMVTVSESSSGAGSTASPRIITRTFTATDSHGNSASAVQTITVIDPTPPTFTSVPGNVIAYTGPGAVSCSTTVSDAALGTATAEDNCSVVVTRSGVPAGNNFPVGNTTVTYTATDAAGNTAVATQTVTVIDNTPPTISCAADIVADFDPAVNGAVVTYTAPVGADNCAGATTTQTAGLASGSTFPVGTTTNTFRLTDSAGNTAECSFKVTVALTSIIGLDSVSIGGAGQVDSYDSTGGYPATKGSLANILSNGTITLTNSGKVWGNVRSTLGGVNVSGASQVTGNATAGTTVTRSGSAIVGGTISNYQLAPAMSLPSVPACGPAYSPNTGISGSYSYNSTTGDLSLSGVNIATLANGTYCFRNVTLTNSAQLKVDGPVVIKITGTLNAGGATRLSNTTGIPSNLQVLSSYSGTNGVSFTNSTSAHLLIYAPNTGVTVSGAAPLFGTIAAKTITISNSGMIHYDTQLKSVWPDVWTLILGP